MINISNQYCENDVISLWIIRGGNFPNNCSNDDKKITAIYLETHTGVRGRRSHDRMVHVAKFISTYRITGHHYLSYEFESCS